MWIDNLSIHHMHVLPMEARRGCEIPWRYITVDCQMAAEMKPSYSQKGAGSLNSRALSSALVIFLSKYFFFSDSNLTDINSRLERI